MVPPRSDANEATHTAATPAAARHLLGRGSVTVSIAAWRRGRRTRRGRCHWCLQEPRRNLELGVEVRWWQVLRTEQGDTVGFVVEVQGRGGASKGQGGVVSLLVSESIRVRHCHRKPR